MSSTQTSLIFVSILGVAGWSSDVYAFRTAGDLAEFSGERVAWRAPSVTFSIHDDLPAGVDEDSLGDALDAATAEWNAIDCSEFTFGRETNVGEAIFGDGINTVQVVENWAGRGFDPAAGATSDLRYLEDEDGWFIAEADIFLNAERLMFGDAESIRSVLLHEIGHALGLLHPCEGADCQRLDRESALFPESLGVVSVSEDDRAGVCFLYPIAPLCPLTCPSGERCEEGVCVPGDACVRDRDCASGVCVEGTCAVVAPELGDPCAVDGDCATGTCAEAGYCTVGCGTCPEDWSCTTGQCTPRLRVIGDACSDGRQCASNLCLLDDRGENRCTRNCGDTCPAGMRCADVDGMSVCRTPAGGGCSAANGTASGWVMALLLLGWMRRFQ